MATHAHATDARRDAYALARVRRRAWVYAGAAAFLWIALRFTFGPMPQWESYHDLADTRVYLGVPRAGDVLTNLAILVAGLWGWSIGPRAHLAPEERPAYALLVFGTIATAVGSAYYHLAPSNPTLVWDRLPMTFAFMACVSIVLGEHVSVALARRALWPLVALGVASVAWWAWTDDLRPYALVQFGPVLLLPALLLVSPSALAGTRPLWLVLASYVVAKVLEHWDAAIHALVGFSGHPLKHVAASLAIFAMLGALRRSPRRGDAGPAGE